MIKVIVYSKVITIFVMSITTKQKTTKNEKSKTSYQ